VVVVLGRGYAACNNYASKGQVQIISPAAHQTERESKRTQTVTHKGHDAISHPPFTLMSHHERPRPFQSEDLECNVGGKIKKIKLQK